MSQMGVIATTMTPVERMCAVVLDEMANKKQFDYDRRNDAICGVSGSEAAAKQAMVAMARGILGKWKQASHTLEKNICFDIAVYIQTHLPKPCLSTDHRIFLFSKFNASGGNCGM